MRKKTIDERHIGVEPPENIHLDRIGLIHALNWYNYHFDAKGAEPWLQSYMAKKKSGRVRDLETYTMTMCSLARMHQRNIILPEEYQSTLDTAIKRLKKPTRRKKKEPATTLPNTTENPFLCHLEAILDRFYDGGYKPFEHELHGHLISRGAKQTDSKKIIGHCNNLLVELETYPDDFAHISKRKLNAYKKFLVSLIFDAQKLISTKKPKLVKRRKKIVKKK